MTSTVTISSAPSATTGASGVFTSSPPSQQQMRSDLDRREEERDARAREHHVDGDGVDDDVVGRARGGAVRMHEAHHLPGVRVDRIDREARAARRDALAAERPRPSRSRSGDVSARNGSRIALEEPAHQLEARRQQVLDPERRAGCSRAPARDGCASAGGTRATAWRTESQRDESRPSVRGSTPRSDGSRRRRWLAIDRRVERDAAPERPSSRAATSRRR